jgi:hypothetical protein
MSFAPNFIDPSTKSDEALWFVYHQDRLLIKTGANGYRVPRFRDIAAYKSTSTVDLCRDCLQEALDSFDVEDNIEPE